nr:nucleotidyltransferase family protein [Gemmobacter aquatilis]
MPPTILLLAAGASSRMRGGDKLLEQVDGQPQLRRAALAALASGAPVRVALPPDHPARLAALEGLPVTQIIVPDADLGMSASIRAGAAGVRGGLMILPADMPEIDAKIIMQLVELHYENSRLILRGASHGTPGHPVLIPADLLPALANLTGDEGARAVLKAHAACLHLVDLPGQAALTDLDTPEDWAAWRAARQS